MNRWPLILVPGAIGLIFFGIIARQPETVPMDRSEADGRVEAAAISAPVLESSHETDNTSLQGSISEQFGNNRIPEMKSSTLPPARTTVGIVETATQIDLPIARPEMMRYSSSGSVPDSEVERIRATGRKPTSASMIPGLQSPETGDGPLGLNPVPNDSGSGGPARVESPGAYLQDGNPVQLGGPSEGTLGKRATIDISGLPGPGEGAFDSDSPGPGDPAPDAPSRENR